MYSSWRGKQSPLDCGGDEGLSGEDERNSSRLHESISIGFFHTDMGIGFRLTAAAWNGYWLILAAELVLWDAQAELQVHAKAKNRDYCPDDPEDEGHDDAVGSANDGGVCRIDPRAFSAVSMVGGGFFFPFLAISKLLYFIPIIRFTMIQTTEKNLSFWLFGVSVIKALGFSSAALTDCL